MFLFYRIFPLFKRSILRKVDFPPFNILWCFWRIYQGTCRKGNDFNEIRHNKKINVFKEAVNMSKVAIITGGGSGLGQAAAIRWAIEGINIAVVDINEEGGNETVKMVEQCISSCDFTLC
jgi:hypothetical protein